MGKSPRCDRLRSLRWCRSKSQNEWIELQPLSFELCHRSPIRCHWQTGGLPDPTPEDTHCRLHAVPSLAYSSFLSFLILSESTRSLGAADSSKQARSWQPRLSSFTSQCCTVCGDPDVSNVGMELRPFCCPNHCVAGFLRTSFPCCVFSSKPSNLDAWSSSPLKPAWQPRASPIFKHFPAFGCSRSSALLCGRLAISPKVPHDCSPDASTEQAFGEQPEYLVVWSELHHWPI